MRRKVEIIPNAVDTSLFVPRAKVPGVVTVVSRLSKEKNLTSVIHACACLPWVTLNIIGDGPEYEKLHTLAWDLGVHTIWHRTLRNDMVAYILGGSEFYVLASHYDQSPKALLEAMAAGCICIATHGCGDVIQDGVTGYLCDDMPKGILDALGRATSRPDRQQVGRAARGWVMANRSLVEAVADERMVLEGLCRE